MGVKLKERKPGEWWLFINHKGKRKAKKIGSREAAESAKADLEEALGKRDLNLRNRSQIVTIRQYSKQWLEGHVAKNLKEATVRDYQDTLDRFILPEFGAVPIDELRRDELKAYCFQLLGKTYIKGKDVDGNPIRKPYSKTTAHHIVRVLSAIINHAREDGLTSVNVAERPGKFVRLPKPGSKADVLTPEETDHLLETTRQHYPDLYPLILLLFRSSLRKGEVRGLQWGDIDWHGKFITVRRAFSKEELGLPKSGEERAVVIGDRLLAALREHERRTKATMLRRGKSTMPTWVFCNREDRPLGDGTVNDYLNRCLTKAGLRHIRVHDTRHTFISQHLEAGTTLEQAKRLAGHSTIKLTSDTYGHKVRDMGREIANRLDKPRETDESATQTQPTALSGSIPL